MNWHQIYLFLVSMNSTKFLICFPKKNYVVFGYFKFYFIFKIISIITYQRIHLYKYYKK